MRSSVWRISAIAVAIAYTSCVNAGAGGDNTGPHDPPTVLDVPLLDGTTEPVWIYVATPSTPGPHPVVIYGHGQGTGNLINCTPDRAPADGDAQTGMRIANDLAARGYLAIALFYRNRGAGIPAVDELRGRDHYIFDSRAFLAAAHLAHDKLGGDARAALIGVSMGSYPATWAAAPLPELADLQANLELVTSIPTAMLGNHIANTGRNKYLLTTTDEALRRAAIAYEAITAIGPRLALTHDASLTADDLANPANTTGVTPAGAELVRRTFLAAPDPSLAGCAALATARVPVACSPECSASTYAAVATAHGITGATPSDWLAPQTIAAIQYWNPPTAIDPTTATTNAMLADLRALSPAYALTGPLRTKRLLPLVSYGDRVVIDQLNQSNAPAELYLARLQATGVSIPDPVPVVRDTTCGHDDYLDPTRPQCGWTIVLDELEAAFAQ